MEIVRADTNGRSSWLTPAGELQDKSDRYYFKKAHFLSNGGKKQGVLMLNVFGSSFLNLLANQQEQVRGGEHYYLLNEEEYFLSLNGEALDVYSAQAFHWILLTTGDDTNLFVGFDEYVQEF